MRPVELPGWLAEPALLPVWRALRSRLEKGSASARLPGFDQGTRHALAAVLGRPVPGSVTIDLVDLSADLQRRAGLGLAEIIEATTGPLRDRPAEVASARTRRQEPISLLETLTNGLDVSWRPEWIERVRATGLLSRQADWEQTVRHSASVLALVLAGPSGHEQRQVWSRTRLAAAATGDAHALDPGSPVSGLVLRALALQTGAQWPLDAEARRRVWNELGVLADLVSQTVLTLGLPGERAGPTHLTAWSLERRPVAIARGSSVLVVENPAVLEALIEVDGAVVICGSGWPSLLCLDVLSSLASCGARLQYHGDFDWAGLAIANHVIARCGARPWQMEVANYGFAASRGEGLSLVGEPVVATWSAALTSSMMQAGRAVHEEEVIDEIVTSVREWRSD